MKKISLAIASALLLASGGSFAASLSISPAVATALPGAGNPTNPTPITVQWDATGLAAGEGDSIDGTVTFDSTKLSVSVTGDCAVNGGNPGEVIIAALNIQGNTIPSGAICTMTFTTLAGAADGNVIPLDLGNTVVGDGGAALAVQPPATDGVVNIAAVVAAPPTINFTPNGGAVVLPGVIGVSTSGGDPGGTASYNCTVPAGYTVSNSTAAGIVTGSDPADMNASCVAGTPDTTMTCTRTGGNTADVVFNLDCPAAPAPVLASNPANGTTLNCDGAPGAIVQTQATIQNTGNADMTGVACNVANTVGTSFSLQTAPSGTIAAGASSTAVVSCTVPLAGNPTSTGTLSCTTAAPAGGALAFPLSSSGNTVPTFVAPDIVPASSLWSKIGLIGLLAALGMLVVGFRRSH